jgi:prohibitin 1
MSQVLLDRLIRWSVPVGLGLTVLSNSIYNVDGGERAVIFDRLTGVKKTVVGEGMHFVIPWLQRPIIYDIRIRPKIITTTTGSKGIYPVY